MNQKLLEAEEDFKKKLFEKEDHFEREIEVLRKENKRMKEHLRMDKEERKANQVEMLREDMKDKMEHKELVLKMEDKEARLEELEEETDKLNKSLEIEKNERSSLESELLEVRHGYCFFCFIIDFHYS